MKTRIFFCISFLIFYSSMIFAGLPTFNIVPTPGTITAFLLPPNFIETVHYQVTNQTHVTRTLTMVPIPGVSQVTSGGACPSPFTLAPGQSCILSLVVNGAAVPLAGIHSGPQICKTKGPYDPSPDPMLCAQPNLNNTLAVSITSSNGQHAYIANQTSNSVSVCQVNPATGFLSQCQVSATGLTGIEGVGFNPSGTLFYSANPLGNFISVCHVNPNNGLLSNCINAGGSGFNLPDAVAFNTNGTIFYTSNFGALNVTACLVNATDGTLSLCENSSSLTFNAPGDMALNSAATLAYVVNRITSKTSVCNVSGQMVNSCNDLSGSLFDQPEGITLSLSGARAYIANAGSHNIVVCHILQNGTGLLDQCSITGGEFRGTGNIGLNNNETFAYVPNQLLNDVFLCQVAPITGQLSNCISARGTGLSGPAGVVLH